MKKRILTLIATTFLFTAVSYSCDIQGKSGFAPKNNLRISKFDKSTNMTESMFLSIIKSVSDIYTPIVKSKGGTLLMNNNWDDDTVNASAERNESIWIVNMFGGLARHPLITNDGFALVVCHELAHHIGGAPRKGTSWVANEGQADYFGSMKCLRRVLEKANNINVVSRMNIDPLVTKNCEMVYKNENEIAICQRISMAGKSLGNLLSKLGESENVHFNTPDKSVVSSTNDTHPAAQCRLDTYFNGILCDKSYDQDTDNNDPKIGNCISRDGYKVGPRPLCWYKPTSSEI